MTQFNQFDISDFLDEIQEPLMLLDSEEIIYWNSYFTDNFLDFGDDWRVFFSNPDLVRELEEFFQGGKLPQSRFIKSLSDKAGGSLRFEWSFINVPSSFNSRFLIAKGNRIRVYSNPSEENLLSQGSSLTEELRYMQSILNNSHDLIAILDADGFYKFISPSVSEKLGVPVSEILGKNFQEFIQSGFMELVVGDFKDVLVTKEEVAVDFWVRLRDGRKILLESFAKNLLDHPQIQGILFSSRDATVLFQTKRTLERRFEIENLINQISSQLINSRFFDLEKVFQDALQKFGDFLNSFSSKILIFNKETNEVDVLNWLSSDAQPNNNKSLDKGVLSVISDAKEILQDGKVQFLLPTSQDISTGDPKEYGLILIPMISGNRLLGAIKFKVDPQDSFFQKTNFRFSGNWVIFLPAHIWAVRLRKSLNEMKIS
jgi:PAS domain S-box-containing protein